MSVLTDRFASGDLLRYDGEVWVVTGVLYDPEKDQHFVRAMSARDPEKGIQFLGDEDCEPSIINLSRGETYWVEV